jgi:hypothetical protein
MSMRFSQRVGLTPVGKLAQRESIDDELRAGLWSLLSLCYWGRVRNQFGGPLQRGTKTLSSTLSELIIRLWLHYFKKPTDEIENYWESFMQKLRSYYFNAQWFEVYDFVEFIAQNGPIDTRGSFIDMCNELLERENSAYRFVEGQIAEITSKAEIEAVEMAIEAAGPYAGVSSHLTSALALMSDRTSPDYRNSIKESICAVESLAEQIAKKPSATLGVVLNELERTHALHPALKSAFSSLYGYTSNAQGIRHGLLDEPTLSKADARFMLVCCSAFVNYVVEATRHFDT